MATKTNKVFTKVFAGVIAVLVPEVQPPLVTNALHSWLLQDDIEILGIDGAMVNSKPSENDGFSSVVLEVSQSGIYGTDGALFAIGATEGWNTTPAGICEVNGDKSTMLPSGKTVSVREEGHLYINVSTWGKTAGESKYDFHIIIYYTKGK